MVWRSAAATAAVLLTLAAVGCGGKKENKHATAERTGTLVFTANGEALVREGLLSSDGWRIRFDTALVSLARPAAYQVKGSTGAGGEEGLPADAPGVVLEGNHVVDLAAGDSTADPVVIGSAKDAPSGAYNALQFELVPMDTGTHAGASLVLSGRATKEGETPVDFAVALAPAMTVTCGGYVGEEMKGVLDTGRAEVELTFHLDHLFGDGTRPPEDHVNAGALGFGWIAAAARDGKARVGPVEAAEALGEEGEARLERILRSLPHTGEGHCHCE